MQHLFLLLIYRILVRYFLKVFVGVKFDNAAFLKKEKQFIIVANHNSHLDTMAILASLPSKMLKKVKPVAAADHFGKTRFQERFCNYFINTLLIKRQRDVKNPDKDPVNQMLRAIDEGYSLIIFPEGTRGMPEVQQPLKPGIGLILSQRPNVKYVPAYMKGMGKAMPKDDNFLIPFSSFLIYGEPKKIDNTEVAGIMIQIENDLNILRKRIEQLN